MRLQRPAGLEFVLLTLDLPMMMNKQLDYYVDDKQGKPTKTTLKVDKKGRVNVTIQPNGGIIIVG